MNGAEHAADKAAQVRLPVYEGPLDLLLHLIKRADLDPRDVTASVITSQYLEYLEFLDTLNLEVAGEYLVMAATLLLIKSALLLPDSGSEAAEEAEELKRDLVARLLEYQRYREAAAKLAERPLLGREVFSARGEALPTDEVTTAGHHASLFDLTDAMLAVLRRLETIAPRTIQPRDIPVAACIPMVLTALEGVEKLRFLDLFDGLTDWPRIVATFLAVLELIERGEISALQEQPFGTIFIRRRADRSERADPQKGTRVMPGNNPA
jgi:segregation and condensation protein A